ncbi:MAG: DUF4339 domain-containing protein [Planctomycetes bacterium]|nr:DUF4339 domain-containing protein [Planctomycetota bacterium]
MAQWYFKKNDQKVGPLNDAQMRQVARDGMLGPSDPVWRDGLKDWVPASRIKGLFPASEGVSAMATIQEPMHRQGMPAKTPIPPPKAAPIRPSGQGLPVIEIFEAPPIQASRLPTVMAKPIGGGHKVTISQPQRTASPASAEKPYEPPPLPPTEQPAAPDKPPAREAAAPASPARSAVRQIAPIESPVPDAEEEPVNVEPDEEDDFLAGVKDETAGAKARQAAEELARADADRDIGQAPEKTLQDAGQAGPDGQAGPVGQAGAALSEKDLFPSDTAGQSPQSAGKPAGAKKPDPTTKLSAEIPDHPAGPARPGIGLALAACAIGLLSAAPAGAVFYFASQAGTAAYIGPAGAANQSVLENYRSAIERELSGGLDAALTDWRVLIGLSGALTFLAGLLALPVKVLRKSAAAFFILLALTGLAGHLSLFQIQVCTGKIVLPIQAAPPKPVPRPVPKIQPTPSPATTPAAVPASQPQSSPASTPS